MLLCFVIERPREFSISWRDTVGNSHFARFGQDQFSELSERWQAYRCAAVILEGRKRRLLYESASIG